MASVADSPLTNTVQWEEERKPAGCCSPLGICPGVTHWHPVTGTWRAPCTCPVGSMSTAIFGRNTPCETNDRCWGPAVCPLGHPSEGHRKETGRSCGLTDQDAARRVHSPGSVVLGLASAVSSWSKDTHSCHGLTVTLKGTKCCHLLHAFLSEEGHSPPLNSPLMGGTDIRM